MKQAALGLLAVVAVSLLTGCMSVNRIVGSKITETGNWYGELGITGHVNDITVQSNSRLHKLSIIGDGNKVFLQDRATLGKIEIWGENNSVSIPEWLVVRLNQTGHGNRVLRRASTGVRTTQPLTASTETAFEYEASSEPEPVEGAPTETYRTQSYITPAPTPTQSPPSDRPTHVGEPLEMQPVE